MGLDGGTIPSRSDLLRRSSWRLSSIDNSKSTRGGFVDLGQLTAEHQNLMRLREYARLRFDACALSGDPLRDPMVACHHGKLYNKDAVLEYILQTDKFEHARKDQAYDVFKHLTSTKAVFPVKMKSNPEANQEVDSGTKTAEDGRRSAPCRFVCWVTDMEANGRNTFQILSTCGHAFAEMALKETAKREKQNNGKDDARLCMVCNTPFTEDDVVTLNPSEEQLEVLQTRWKRKLQETKDSRKSKKEKKDKKRKRQRLEGPVESSTKGAEDNKETKKEVTVPVKEGKQKA